MRRDQQAYLNYWWGNDVSLYAGPMGFSKPSMIIASHLGDLSLMGTRQENETSTVRTAMRGRTQVNLNDATNNPDDPWLS